MVIDMNEKKLNTVAQLRAFLEGTEEVQFDSLGEDKRYVFVAEVVRRLRYRYLLRSDKGVVMRYLERTTGYSRQQLKTRWTRHDECFRSFDKTLTTNCLYCIIIGSPGRSRRASAGLVDKPFMRNWRNKIPPEVPPDLLVPRWPIDAQQLLDLCRSEA